MLLVLLLYACDVDDVEFFKYIILFIIFDSRQLAEVQCHTDDEDDDVEDDDVDDEEVAM